MEKLAVEEIDGHEGLLFWAVMWLFVAGSAPIVEISAITYNSFLVRIGLGYSNKLLDCGYRTPIIGLKQLTIIL